MKQRLNSCEFLPQIREYTGYASASLVGKVSERRAHLSPSSPVWVFNRTPLTGVEPF
jgi:hypothetical protein